MRDATILFPLMLKLSGRPCLVVGAGAVAESKIYGLLRSGAAVRVVAPRASRKITAWARAKEISWDPRPFRDDDLNGAFLVIAATSSSAVNHSVFRLAQRRGVLCNVVDDPDFCDFYYPAVVRRGQLQIAISTRGRSPALAQRLRRELQLQFGAEYGPWLEELGEARERLFARQMDAQRRRRLLHQLASRRNFRRSRTANAAREAQS